jgi:hypothetical protein
MRLWSASNDVTTRPDGLDFPDWRQRDIVDCEMARP